MEFVTVLADKTKAALAHLYNVTDAKISFEKTNANFAGDYTFVVFPFVRLSKKSPEATGEEIGAFIKNEVPEITGFNVVKGFLNFELSDNYWLEVAQKRVINGVSIPNIGAGKKVVVEYSSPNTNKPLHLGHVRNNVLGLAMCEILAANGYDVIKNNLVNDRGIHICKSMIAWQKWGNGETPESAGIKGDHLVGKYYVEFDKHYRAEVKALVEKGLAEETAKNEASMMQETRQMLQKWEDGDETVLALWKKMNAWVYAGFDETYKRLGVSFDKIYYESNTYLLGKAMVQEGLASGAFYQKEDNSVWVDLTEDGLDEKIVQRSDGTSVYITQDIGTADLKYQDFKMDKFIYVVGNEQDYHFKVLQLILKKLNKPYADGLFHLSYGMVDLPSGKMKSREGTVVDADDLLQEMYDTAMAKTEELGKTDGMSEAELHELYHRLCIGALKFFILKVDPRKRMLFNPQESIDFQGDTGPFVMYTYARIKSILRNAQFEGCQIKTDLVLHATEMECIKVLNEFKTVLAGAAEEYNPAAICQYVLDLAKSYNKVYNEVSILKESNEDLRNMRLQLALQTSQILQRALRLIGVETVERM